jgi:hypothetical protein
MARSGGIVESEDDSVPEEIRFKLHPKQTIVLQSVATEIFYGGSLGAGKSWLLRALSIYYALAIPQLQVFIFRRTFPELISTHMSGQSSYPELVAPLVNVGRCQLTQTEIRLDNGSKISLHHCQNEVDVGKYLGVEFHLLLIDELTSFTRYIYETLRTRVRLGGLKVPSQFAHKFPLIICSGCPGGIGHQWVREEFVDGGQGMRVRRMSKDRGGMLRQFVDALPEDNPTLLLNDPTYLDRVRGQADKAMVGGWLRGDWSVVSGAMFAAAWDRQAHVCDSFPIPDSWQIFRACDDGYSAPSSVHWIALDRANDRFYCIAELYQSGLLPEDLARLVLARDRSILVTDGYGRVSQNTTRLAGVIDSAAFSDTGTGSPARANQMNKLGCDWKPCEKYPGSVAHRAQKLHEYLARGRDGRPRLIFFRSCVKIIQAVPSILRNPDKPEEFSPHDELIHAIDSLTYGLNYWRERSFKTARLTGI